MQARSSQDPQCRFFARLAVAGLPRGGGDGDAIRHGILNIMRENGIKEGHRPVSLSISVMCCHTRTSRLLTPIPAADSCCELHEDPVAEWLVSSFL